MDLRKQENECNQQRRQDANDTNECNKVSNQYECFICNVNNKSVGDLWDCLADEECWILFSATLMHLYKGIYYTSTELQEIHDNWCYIDNISEHLCTCNTLYVHLYESALDCSYVAYDCPTKYCSQEIYNCRIDLECSQELRNIENIINAYPV